MKTVADEITSLEGKKQKKFNYVKASLRFIGLVLFVIIFIKVGKNELVGKLLTVKLRYLAVASILCAVHFFVKALRWRYILLRKGVVVSPLKAVSVYCATALLGAFTPGRVGEMSKVVAIRSWQPSVSWSGACATVVLDRLFDVTLLAVVSILGAISLLSSVSLMNRAGIFLLMIIVISILVVSIVVNRLKVNKYKTLGVIPKLIGKKKNLGEEFFATLKYLSGKHFWVVALFTIMAYVAFFFHFIYLAAALDTNIPTKVLIWAISVSSLGAILPISISGIGIRDYILVQTFLFWGESASKGLAISLLYLGLFNIIVALIGIWFFVFGNINLKEIFKENKL